MNMAAGVRSLLLSTRIGSIDRPIINQLIRSSSSVAANYRAATRSRSDAEFYAKMSIVVEESDETLFWLEYLVRIEILNMTDTILMREEVEKLVRLFASIRRSMKEKLEKKG